MKFLFLSSFAHLALDPAADTVSGGAELQTALLARALAERGHDAVIIGTDHGQPPDRTLQGVRLRTGGAFHTGGLLDTLTALPRIVRVIREERPDFTLILGWTAWLYILHVLKPILGGKLVFICSSDVEVDGRYRQANPVRGALFERGLRGADVRYAMTNHQAALFKKASLSCSLYRNLVSPYASAESVKKDITFLWISRCQPLKRPHLFLDLADAHPGEKSVLIAPPEDPALYAELEARVKTMPQVTLLPGVPYREVQAWYDRAQIFVNTSEFEGYPNSFIQAGQGGAAILSLLVDPDHVLTQLGAGVCAGGDWEQFLREARALLADPVRLTALQAGAARLVHDLHGTEKNVAAFLAALRVDG